MNANKPVTKEYLGLKYSGDGTAPKLPPQKIDRIICCVSSGSILLEQ
jgi:hypothetical protein